MFAKDLQYFKFSMYGFLKNLRFFESFLLVYFLSRGISYTEIGLLYTIREITRNLLEIPSGLISDSIGRRRSLAFSFLTYISSFLLFYYAGHFGLLALAMFMFAAGDAFRTGTHKAMIYAYLDQKGWKEQKANYYGHTRSWSQTGSAVCALSGAAIILFSASYNTIFLLSIFPALLDMLLILSYPASLEGKGRHIKRKEIAGVFRRQFRHLFQQLQSRSYWYFSNLVSLHSGYYRAIKDYLQAILASFALGISIFGLESEIRREALVIGIAYFLIYLLTAGASRASGRLARGFHNTDMTLFITLLISLGLGSMAGFLQDMHLSLTAAILFTAVFLVENIRKPIGLAAVADHSEKDIMASALSVQSQAGSLYAAVFALLAGICADLWGPGVGIAIVSAFAAFLLLVSRILKKYLSD